MNINAKYFGNIIYDDKETITIDQGLAGFEAYTKYLLLSFSEEDDSMVSLQCLEDENLSFILMNPFYLFPDYNPHLSENDMADLGTTSMQDISFYVVCVVRDSISESTVNLKSPLAINAVTRHAKQIILDQPEYHFRHTLGEHKDKEE